MLDQISIKTDMDSDQEDGLHKKCGLEAFAVPKEYPKDGGQNDDRACVLTESLSDTGLASVIQLQITTLSRRTNEDLEL